MDSSPTRDRRRSPIHDPASLNGSVTEILRALTTVTSAAELERMLLALAVHPAGPGFDRARLLLWDVERDRFTARSAERASDASPTLGDALARGRFPLAGQDGGEIAERAPEIAPDDLSEPAVSAWRHRVAIVAKGSVRSGRPWLATAPLHRPSGIHGLLIGEWDECRRGEDLDQQLAAFVALADWALAEHERRSEDWLRARQVSAIAELARTSASPCNLAEVLHQSVRLAALATGAQGSALWLKNGDDAPRLEITQGAPVVRDRLARALQAIAAQVVSTGRARHVDCAADDPLLSPDAAASLHALAVVPLTAYERTVGALAVYDPVRPHAAASRAFGRAAREALVTLADLTAMAVDHAGRFAELSAVAHRHGELTARLARQERLAGVGESAAKIAEEARQPITSIRTFTRRAREALVEGAAEREYLEIVLREADRLERMLGEQLDRTTLEPPSLSLHNLNEIVQENLQKIGEMLVRRRVRLLKKLSPELPVLLIDSERIGHMMARVLDNALEAVSIGGRVRVETRRAGNFAVIEMAHDGPRTPGTALDHLFVPFASSKNGQGVGLGVAQRIVREHGGEVRVRADGEWSTVVVFTLPIPDNQDRRRGNVDRRQGRNERRRRVPAK